MRVRGTGEGSAEGAGVQGCYGVVGVVGGGGCRRRRGEDGEAGAGGGGRDGVISHKLEGSIPDVVVGVGVGVGMGRCIIRRRGRCETLWKL